MTDALNNATWGSRSGWCVLLFHADRKRSELLSGLVENTPWRLFIMNCFQRNMNCSAFVYCTLYSEQFNVSFRFRCQLETNKILLMIFSKGNMKPVTFNRTHICPPQWCICILNWMRPRPKIKFLKLNFWGTFWDNFGLTSPHNWSAPLTEDPGSCPYPCIPEYFSVRSAQI